MVASNPWKSLEFYLSLENTMIYPCNILKDQLRVLEKIDRKN